MTFGIRRFLLRLGLLVAVCVNTACGDDTPTTPTPPPAPALAILCPGNVQGQSANGAPVTITPPQPTTTGGVLPVTVSCTPSATTFPVGTTQVTCNAVDSRTTRASCSYSVNVAPPPLPMTSFMAFGDSMTAGEITVPVPGGLDANGFPPYRLIVVPSESYPTELATLLRNRYVTQAGQINVVNAGVPREWAADGMKRFPQAFAAARPQVVLIMEGANDLAALGTRGINPALTGLQGMVRYAKANGALVFVASIPPSRPGGINTLPLVQITALNEQIRLGAIAEGATFVDVYSAIAASADLYIGVDGLHPNELGYQRIAETFFTAIRVAAEGR